MPNFQIKVLFSFSRRTILKPQSQCHDPTQLNNQFKGVFSVYPVMKFQ